MGKHQRGGGGAMNTTYPTYSTNHPSAMNPHGSGGGSGGDGVNHLSAGIPGLSPSPLTPSVLSSMASELMTHNNQHHAPSHQGLGSGGFSYSPTSTSTTYPGFTRPSSVHSPPQSPLASHNTSSSHSPSTNSSLLPPPVPTAGGNISQAMVASAVVQVP